VPTPPTEPRRALAPVAVGLLMACALPQPVVAQATNVVGTARSPSLTRYIPAKDLAFFAEFDGLDAHPAAWRRTAAWKLLNETKLGAMLDDLATQGLEKAVASAPPGSQPKATEILDLIKAVAKDGFVLGVAAEGGRAVLTVGLRNGSKNGVRAIMERVEASSKEKPRIEARGKRAIKVDGGPDSASAYWAEGNDLILTFPVAANADAIVAAIEGKAPNTSTNPARTDLLKPEAGFEPALIAFLDVSRFPVPPEMAKVGLDGFKGADYRWGFQDDALYSVLRIKAPAPRRGLLGLLDGPTFDKTSLPPIPSGLTSWTVSSISPGVLWDKLATIVKEALPPGGPEFKDTGMGKFEAQFNQVLGVRLREDLLAPMGPRWVFYVDSDPAKAGAGQGNVRAALTAEIKDSAAFARSLDKVIAFANQAIQAQAARTPGGADRAVQIRKVAGTTPGYNVVLPPGTLPPAAAALISPTILVGRTQLIVGLSEAEAKAALTAEGRATSRWTPTTEHKIPFAKLPKDLVILGVSDPRASMPQIVESTPALLAGLNATLAAQAQGKPALSFRIDPAKVPTASEIRGRLFPSTQAVAVDRGGLTVVTRESVPSLSSPAFAGVAVGLMLPAVQSAREAARRAQCVNNLKQIGLAMHNANSMNGAFPAAAIAGPDGKPLLSWRVAILPFIGQESLYKQFKLDEPWDGPHNKALIAQMPATYLCPSFARPEPGMTTYRAFVGGGAAFDPKRPVKLDEFTDGTANTLLVVESRSAVPWTKPEDIDFNPQSPPSLLAAGSVHPGGFNALYADGSVRFVPSTTDPKTFRALITRAGGEAVPGP